MHNDLTPFLIAQRYKPLFPRARGGFSDVIIAWDTRLARRVAIKKINTGKSLPVASLEEARTAALLSSPNIVSIYDFVDNWSETLIIMENVDGPSLAELMRDSSELLELNVATTILEGIVSALEYAHENQVLHLDIKPANILIDQSGHIKVSDFGLAELAGVDGFGEVQGGTLGYMPPEQLTGKMVDTRTDIWALAALSYQLLTGINPFFALSPRESLEYSVGENYPLPSELRPELGGGVDEALVKALNPQMEERHDSVAEFWLALRPYLGRIGPGRTRLKVLARTWAGKEAALLEDPEESASLADEQREEEISELPETTYEDDLYEEKHIAIWDSNYDDEDKRDDDDEGVDWKDNASENRHRRTPKRSENSHRRTPKRSENRERPSGPALWQRLSPGSQVFFSRCFCTLAAASMVWLAMSALPYLSDPLAQAATTAAANTGNPAPALLDAAFTIRLTLMIIVAVVSFIVPSIGTGLAVIGLGFGLFFTGNWLLGILVLASCIVWWICIGRHNPADSAVFALSPLLAVLSLPMLVPLLSGFFQSWRRALGTTALACFVCSLLSLLTYGFVDTLFATVLGIGDMSVYGQFSLIPLKDLLSISPTLMQMPDGNQLFIPLMNLFTAPEFWIILAGWLGASVVMSLLNSGQSRVKYVLVTLLGAGIVAAGYLFPFFVFASQENVSLLAAIIVRLVITLALCLLLIAIGIQARPSMHKGKGRKSR